MPSASTGDAKYVLVIIMLLTWTSYPRSPRGIQGVEIENERKLDFSRSASQTATLDLRKNDNTAGAFPQRKDTGRKAGISV
jgi:hypothetical protein